MYSGWDVSILVSFFGGCLDFNLNPTSNIMSEIYEDQLVSGVIPQTMGTIFIIQRVHLHRLFYGY